MGYSYVDAAINYLHQRRLGQAIRVNSEAGFEGACDGFLHKKRYNSRGKGLLLDVIDPFKFADREELLMVILNRGLTWKDFRVETDRRGTNFYYPMNQAVTKLERAGSDADDLSVRYQDRDMRLSDAYRKFADNLLGVLADQNVVETKFYPFVFEFPKEAQ